MRSNVEGRCVPLIALFAIVSRRSTVTAVLKPLRLGFNLLVARGFAQPLLRELIIARRINVRKWSLPTHFAAYSSGLTSTAVRVPHAVDVKTLYYISGGAPLALGSVAWASP